MEIVSNVWMAARSGALYISFSIEEMEISNQEDIKEQEELDRQLLDLGRTVPLPEPEVPQPACPLPVRRWSLELGELCWGRSQIMTGECSPVSLHNYLLIWNTAKWMFYIQGKNHFEFLNAFTGVSEFFHVTQRSFLMREKREMECVEGNSGGKWSEEIESEILRLSVLH